MSVASSTRVVTKTNSLMLVRNLLRASFAVICHNRGFCGPEDFDEEPTVFAGVNIPKLLASSPRASKLITWLEEGVFDAINKRYLKELIFGLRKTPRSPILLESYHFAFDYIATDVQLSFNGSKSSNKGFVRGYTFEEVSQEVQVMLTHVLRTVSSLKPLQGHSFMWMQLEYHPETPKDYAPPCFDTTNVVDNELEYEGPPRKVVFGAVRSGHHTVSAKVVAPKQSFYTAPEIPTPSSVVGPVATNSQDASFDSDTQAEPDVDAHTSKHSTSSAMPPPSTIPKTFSRKRVPSPPTQAKSKQQEQTPAWQTHYDAVVKGIGKKKQPVVMTREEMVAKFDIPDKLAQKVYDKLYEDCVLETPPKVVTRGKKADPPRPVAKAPAVPSPIPPTSMATAAIENDVSMTEGDEMASQSSSAHATISDEEAEEEQASQASEVPASQTSIIAKADADKVREFVAAEEAYLKALKLLLEKRFVKMLTLDQLRSELKCGGALVSVISKRLAEDECFSGMGRGRKINKAKTQTVYDTLNDKITRAKAKLARLEP